MEENRLVVNEMSKATGSANSRNLKKVNINPKKTDSIHFSIFGMKKGKKSSAMQQILTL